MSCPFANQNRQSSRSSRASYAQSRQQQQQQQNFEHPKSDIERQMLNASVPIKLNETEQITVNGVRGIYANKSEVANWRGPVPLEQYKLNVDSNPEVIKKRPTQKLKYTQEIAVRYLQPPELPKPGDIIIKQEPAKPVAPAPPLVIRQLPRNAGTPEPIVIREAPPRPPSIFENKVIRVPAKDLPPPPRRVVVEKFPDEPQKPAPIIIERWLPYKPRKVKVILQKQDPCSCNQQPQSSSQQNNLQEIANSFAKVTDSYSNQQRLPELEGDREALEALRKVDLERYGLSEYRNVLNRN